MENGFGNKGLVDAAVGAIAADGCFCLAFVVHLANSATALTIEDYLAMGAIIGVFISACWIISDDYWRGRSLADAVVKKLRIKELSEGAAVEFDGKSYRVDAISRSMGTIRLNRVGQPGSIIVEIEGES